MLCGGVVWKCGQFLRALRGVRAVGAETRRGARAIAAIAIRGKGEVRGGLWGCCTEHGRIAIALQMCGRTR